MSSYIIKVNILLKIETILRRLMQHIYLLS